MTMNQNEAYAPAGGITGVPNVAYGVINKQKVPAEPEYLEISELPRKENIESKNPYYEEIAPRLE